MRLPRWVYTSGWLLWGALFFVWEGVALADDQTGDTLSEHVAWLIDWWPPLAIGVVVFLGWLAKHFVIDMRKRR